VQFPAAVHVSNVMLVCPHTDTPTRIAYKITEGGEKVRVSKKSGKEI
jgi:large subunit ribosomal protein L24